MEKYNVTPMCVGMIRRPRKNMVSGCGDDTLTDFPLIAYYVEGGGHRILIDIGGSPPNQKLWQPYTQIPEQTLENQLINIGVKIDQIDTVILTHIHWDHSGTADSIINAKFYVQKKEIENLNMPGVEKERIERISFETVEGDCEILPGISVILTPGHSVGMQCVLVNTVQGMAIMTGDLIPTYSKDDKGIPIPGTYYDKDIMEKSINKIIKYNCRLLPGHEMP